MADQAQIEVVISAQADRVLAGLASFERSLKTIEAAHLMAGKQAETHGNQIEALTGKIRNLANIGNLFIAWQAVERALSAFSGLEQFNIDLLHTTQLLGGNAEAASTWSALANQMGIDITTIDRAFAKLSVDLNSGSSPALKQMGITAEDAHGKLRPLNDVLNDAANYFHAHAGASNEAALANALFGKSGYQLLPILEQGQAGLAAFTAEARKYGLILDAETIQRNAAFTFQLKEAEMAVRGLGMSLGNAALPGIAALGQALSRVIADNLPAFVAAVNRAVSYVVGFIEAFTGMSLAVDQGAMTLSDFSTVAGDTGSAMDKAGGASKALAEKQRQITEAARDATAAIDDQIRALTAQQAATAFIDKQAQLQDQLTDKNKEVLKLQHQQYTDYWLGNFQAAVNTGDQITKAQEEAAGLQLQITRSTEDNANKLKVAGLEEQKRRINDGAQAQVQALQRAAEAGTAAFGVAAGRIPPLFDAAGQASAAKFKFAMDNAAEATGVSMGKKLMDAIFGPETQTIVTSGKGGNIEKIITGRSGGGDFLKIGGAIGEAIGTGIITAMGNKVANYWRGVENGLHTAGQTSAGLGILATIFQTPPKAFAEGGMVPGPLGSPQLAVVHGGENVQTPAQQKQAATVDMKTVEALLRQLIALVASSSNASPPRAGTDAMLSELMERASRMRARGMAGAFAR